MSINYTWRIQADHRIKYTLLFSVDYLGHDRNDFGHPWSWPYMYIIYSVIELWTPLYPFTFSRVRAISVEKDLFYFYYYYAPHLFVRKKRCFASTYVYDIITQKCIPIRKNGLSLYTLNIGSWMEFGRHSHAPE